MLKENENIVKKFLSSIKNAVMAMSVENLKESSIQDVLDNSKAINAIEDTYNVILIAYPSNVNKLTFLKLIRQYNPEMGLADANTLLENLPGVLKGNVHINEAIEIQIAFVELGATIKIVEVTETESK